MNRISNRWRSLIHYCRWQIRRSPWPGQARWLMLIASAASLAWFLIRVIPKPIRATYPCQQAAFPLASAFVIWLLGLKTGLAALARAQARKLRLLRMACSVLLILFLAAWGVRAAVNYLAGPAPGWHPTDPPNSPMGVARGIHPGRVVWTHDPSAAHWDGLSSWTNQYSEDRFTSATAAESMLSATVRKLTSQESDVAAWDAIFRYYNQTHGRGNNGYARGETITIKVNCNNTGGDDLILPNLIDATPQTVKALLRQLVNAAGIPQTNIIVYDAVRNVGKLQVYCTNDLPGVQFRDSYQGCTPFVPAITFATNVVASYSGWLPSCVTNATYGINLALLKRHCEPVAPAEWRSQGNSAITCCFKNFFGSCGSPSGMHSMIWDWRNGMNVYNAQVDLAGSRHLDGKTVLYLIDGLYGGNRFDAVPVKWNLPPFNGNWPNSLFGSQDIVAIDSVALDFLRSEWGLMPNADNFLHEAALANNPPSGFAYKPNGDGVRLASLGVHEHWNNCLNKQYSRNLDTNASGIELVTVHPAGSGISVALTRPLNRMVVNPGANVALLATASSGYTGMRQVDFYANGSRLGTSTNAPYSAVWSNAAPGDWVLTAVACDAERLSATSVVVNVAVKATDLTVVLTHPTNSALLPEGKNVNVQAAADSSQSGIRKLELYVDDTFLGASTNNPGDLLWPNPLPGAWVLRAVATDAEGLCASSDPVTVTVRPANLAIAGTLYVDLRAANFSSASGIWTNWGTLDNFMQYHRPPLVNNVSNTGVPGIAFDFKTNAFIGPDTPPDLDGSSDRSVEVWAYSRVVGLGPYRPLVSWSHRGGGNATEFAVNYSADLAHGAAVHGGLDYDLGWGEASNVPPAETWHHLVYTYDGGTQSRIYVDGALRFAKTLPGPLNTDAAGSILIAGCSSLLGARPDNSLSYFGYINSVRIHGGVLSAADVATNFAVGPAAAAAPPAIREIAVQNNSLLLSFKTVIGRNYVIECATNLYSPHWMPLGPAQAALNWSLTITDVLSGAQEKYYRVGVLP